jgi:hypothetical protein
MNSLFCVQPTAFKPFDRPIQQASLVLLAMVNGVDLDAEFKKESARDQSL